MKILLVRHGAAADGEFPELLRPLTPEGRRSVKRLARSLDRSRLRIDAIVSSPLTRAVQTAEILLAKLPKSHPVRQVECLPEMAGDFIPARFSRTAFLGWLATFDPMTLILVGHEPTLITLAAWIDPSLENSDDLRGLAKATALFFIGPPGENGGFKGRIFPAD